MRRRIHRGVAVVTCTLLLSGEAAGHVDYVAEGREDATTAEVVSSVLTSPGSVLLLLGVASLSVCATVGYTRYAKRLTDVEVARRTLSSYRPYLPWMLRLAVGLPLVGAGFSGYLFTPEVGISARIPQVAIGFFLLFGLATRISAAAGLVGYLMALYQYPSVLLGFEYVAGFLSIVIVGPGQPSADMLVRRMVVTDGTFMSRFRGVTTPAELVAGIGLTQGMVPIVLRTVLGGTFVYLGVTQKWLQPGVALSVVERYGLASVTPISPELWVFGAGLGEIAVGSLLFLGLFTRAGAAAAFGILTMTLFGLPGDPVLAHVTLFGLLSAVLVVGGGSYSLDRRVVPSVRERLSPTPPPSASAAVSASETESTSE